jgi:hypothetical protein
MIPDVFDQNSARREEGVSLAVVFLLSGKSVTEPIQFDGQLCLETVKIQIVRFFVMLAAKFVSSQLARSKHLPKAFFSPGGTLPQLSGSRRRHGPARH